MMLSRKIWVFGSVCPALANVLKLFAAKNRKLELLNTDHRRKVILKILILFDNKFIKIW